MVRFSFFLVLQWHLFGEVGEATQQTEKKEALNEAIGRQK